MAVCTPRAQQLKKSPERQAAQAVAKAIEKRTAETNFLRVHALIGIEGEEKAHKAANDARKDASAAALQVPDTDERASPFHLHTEEEGEIIAQRDMAAHAIEQTINKRAAKDSDSVVSRWQRRQRR